MAALGSVHQLRQIMLPEQYYALVGFKGRKPTLKAIFVDSIATLRIAMKLPGMGRHSGILCFKVHPEVIIERGTPTHLASGGVILACLR